jgi:uncharacterized protein
MRSAEKKNVSAIYHLALMCLTGDGIEADPKRGIALLHQAADLNNADALFLSGETYFSGSDGEDIAYPRALHNLGVMYYNGFGTKIDYEKAFYAYQNASVFGHIGAVENLADMYQKGLGVPQRFESPQDRRPFLLDFFAVSSSSWQIHLMILMFSFAELVGCI